MECPICNKKIGKAGYKIECSGKCGKWHQLQCTGLPKEDIEKAKRPTCKFTWVCKLCTETSSSEDSDSSNDGSDSSPPSKKKIKIRKKSKKSSNTSMSMFKEKPTNKEMMLFFDKRFADLESSLNFNNSLMEEMKSTLYDMQEENKKLKRENESIKTKISDLNKEIALIKIKIGREENEEKNKNVVIIGLRTKSDEEVKNDIKKILKTVELAELEDCFTATVVSSRNPSKPVVVTFKTEEQRNLVLEKRKAKGRLESTECGIAGVQTKLYINEDLPMETRILFNKARTLKEAGYKYVWCKNGIVYCRKSDESRAFKVVSFEQIDELKKK